MPDPSDLGAAIAAGPDAMTGSTADGVPEELLARLREICLRLPEAHEEEAWVGSRWRIRNQTFAHIVRIADGWPPAYARAAGTDGPAVVLTFQSAGSDLDALSAAGAPFFRPVWRPGIVGMRLDDGVDWDEITELLTDSYCLLAPRKLVELVDRPAG